MLDKTTDMTTMSKQVMVVMVCWPLPITSPVIDNILVLTRFRGPEMSSYDPPVQGGYEEPNGKRAILNQCKDIEQGIEEVEKSIEQVQGLYRRLLTDADPARENAIRSQADGLATDAKRLYQNLIQRLKSIKQSPGAGESINSAQIGKVERRLKTAITNFQRVQSEFRKDLEAQMARQYRIVRPDATDAEVQEAVQDPSKQQIFSQAVST